MKHAQSVILTSLAGAALIVVIALPPGTASAAEECGVLPANPARLQSAGENPDLAYDLSEKGYLAFERKDFHCAAFFNSEAYRYQPDPVLMQNVANALKEGKQYDAAARYARATLELNPDPPEVEAANALLAEVDPPLAGPAFVQVTLADYDATALIVEWIRYEPGDAPLLKKGSYNVSIERLGKALSIESISVPKLEDLPPPPPQKKSEWKLWAGLAAGGAGVILLGTTLAIDVSVGSKIDDYESLRDCLEGTTECPQETRTRDDYNALGDDIAGLTDTELITAIGGGVLTIVGGGLLAWHVLASDKGAATEEETVSWALAPIVGTESARLLLQVSF